MVHLRVFKVNKKTSQFSEDLFLKEKIVISPSSQTIIATVIDSIFKKNRIDLKVLNLEVQDGNNPSQLLENSSTVETRQKNCILHLVTRPIIDKRKPTFSGNANEVDMNDLEVRLKKMGVAVNNSMDLDSTCAATTVDATSQGEKLHYDGIFKIAQRFGIEVGISTMVMITGFELSDRENMATKAIETRAFLVHLLNQGKFTIHPQENVARVLSRVRIGVWERAMTLFVELAQATAIYADRCGAPNACTQNTTAHGFVKGQEFTLTPLMKEQTQLLARGEPLVLIAAAMTPNSANSVVAAYTIGAINDRLKPDMDGPGSIISVVSKFKLFVKGGGKSGGSVGLQRAVFILALGPDPDIVADMRRALGATHEVSKKKEEMGNLATKWVMADMHGDKIFLHYKVESFIEEERGHVPYECLMSNKKILTIENISRHVGILSIIHVITKKLMLPDDSILAMEANERRLHVLLPASYIEMSASPLGEELKLQRLIEQRLGDPNAASELNGGGDTFTTTSMENHPNGIWCREQVGLGNTAVPKGASKLAVVAGAKLITLEDPTAWLGGSVGGGGGCHLVSSNSSTMASQSASDMFQHRSVSGAWADHSRSNSPGKRQRKGAFGGESSLGSASTPIRIDGDGADLYHDARGDSAVASSSGGVDVSSSSPINLLLVHSSSEVSENGSYFFDVNRFLADTRDDEEDLQSPELALLKSASTNLKKYKSIIRSKPSTLPQQEELVAINAAIDAIGDRIDELDQK